MPSKKVMRARAEKRAAGAAAGPTGAAPEPAAASGPPPTAPGPAQASRSVVGAAEAVLVESVAGLSLQLTKGETTFAHRPDHGTKGRKIKIFANYFPVNVQPDVAYHYDIDMVRVRDEAPGRGGGTGAARGGGGATDEPPKFPKKLKRAIFEQMVTENSREGGLFKDNPGFFDAEKIMYTWNELQPDAGQFTVTLTVTGCRDSVFRVKYQFATYVNIKDGSEQAIQAMDIIARHYPALGHVVVGSSVYESEKNVRRDIIGGNLTMAIGSYQSVRNTESGLMVNLDRTCVAFNAGGKMTDVLQRLWGEKHSRDKGRFDLATLRLEDTERRAYAKELKDLKIVTNHLGYRQEHKLVDIVKRDANEMTFDWKEKDANGKEKLREANVSIANYFKKKYSINLRYKNLPCISCGNANKPKYFPFEICDLIPDQVFTKKMGERLQGEMTRKATAQRPRERMGFIVGAAERVDQINADSGLPIEIVPKPIHLDARVLPPPKLEYNRMQFIPKQEQSCSWYMQKPDKQFRVPGRLDHWVLVNFSRDVSKDFLPVFIKNLKNTARPMNLVIEDPFAIVCLDFEGKDQLIALFNKHNKSASVRRAQGFVEARLQLIVCILPLNNELYAGIKYAGDIRSGVHTQCIKDTNYSRNDRENKLINMAYLSNLLLKINTKLGGINVVLDKTAMPKFLTKSVMIVGLDVTHPAPGDKEGFSIAACIGSYNSSYGQYMADIKLQEKIEGKASKEIVELKEMMAILLKKYVSTNKKPPDHILVYRDGVSKGEFAKVVAKEIPSIKAAYTEYANYDPDLTFVSVQKRHHTRFVPDTQSGSITKSENVVPGTTVDTDIVDPYLFDFYVNSHEALKGTARPAHYCVLHDENFFNADDIQEISYILTYIYARCTKPISIPTPVMYAHLAADKAKKHLYAALGRDFEDTSSSGASSVRAEGAVGGDGGQTGLMLKVAAAVEVHPFLKDKQYFV